MLCSPFPPTPNLIHKSQIPVYTARSELQRVTTVNTQEILSLSELDVLAEGHMSTMARAYVCGGAADELTLRANCEDWQRIRLCPRVLVDVSQLDLSVNILGQQFPTPILLAPAAFHRLCHPEAELATVQGANQGAAGMVLSSL